MSDWQYSKEPWEIVKAWKDGWEVEESAGQEYFPVTDMKFDFSQCHRIRPRQEEPKSDLPEELTGFEEWPEEALIEATNTLIREAKRIRKERGE